MATPILDKTIEVTCHICKSKFTIKVNSDDLEKPGLIQNNLPYLSADERELLLSNICGKCFDKMYNENDE